MCIRVAVRPHLRTVLFFSPLLKLYINTLVFRTLSMLEGSAL